MDLTDMSLKVLLIALLLGFSCGCTIVKDEVGAPLPRVDQATAVGATTAQVLDLLGPPSKVGSLGDGYAFLYEHATVEEKQVGLSVNYFLLRYLKFSYGKAEADREALLLAFDQGGQVIGSSYRRWIEDMGGGNSIQLIISVMSVVDTGEITESPVSMKWGGELLQSRISQALNSGNSPIMGRNGLEQSGTPTGAGQRTLEAGNFPVLNLNSY